MFKRRFLAPVLLALAMAPAAAEAQQASTTLFVKKSYSVQVQKEFWRNGNTYWSQVFETENETYAVLMYVLLHEALESGEICALLNCSDSIIIRDVRLVTRYEYPQLAEPNYYNPDLYLQKR